jgi:hypothetical protein
MQTYFLFNEKLQLVKIGRSTNAVKRIRSLQTAAGVPLTTLGIVEGDSEGQLHEALKDYRQKGEWFTWHPVVRNTIRARGVLGPFPPILDRKKAAPPESATAFDMVHEAERLTAGGTFHEPEGEPWEVWEDFVEAFEECILNRIVEQDFVEADCERLQDILAMTPGAESGLDAAAMLMDQEFGLNPMSGINERFLSAWLVGWATVPRHYGTEFVLFLRPPTSQGSREKLDDLLCDLFEHIDPADDIGFTAFVWKGTAYELRVSDTRPYGTDDDLATSLSADERIQLHAALARLDAVLSPTV